MDRIRRSFLSSRRLSEHISFLVERGAMAVQRDGHLIFHGCVPVDERGEFLSFPVDGVERKGRALFEALDQVVFRAFERRGESDLDVVWYLWGGALSPLFGKDRIAALEADLVADPEARVEQKNPYFRLLHEREFCEKILAEFGADPERGMIVNGHVPVKVEEGESPVKRSGRAVTIDGAFSEAYGDHGFTLVLESGSTYLAKHHHFESLEAAVERGVDIIPTVTPIREHRPLRRVADTERGESIRREIHLLEDLARAYRELRIRPPDAAR
jgi:fructose-1,6-bisphosphatase-3